MKKKLTCLFITPYFSPNIGGVETHFDDILAQGQKHLIRFIVPTYQPIVSGNKGPSIEKRGNSIIYRLSWIGTNLFQKLEKLPFFEFIYLFPGEFLLTLKLAIKYRKSINVIHSQGFIAGAIAIIIAKLFGFKSVITDHTVYYTDKNSLTARIFAFIANKHHKILAAAPAIRNELASWGVFKNKIEIFRYWADTSRFKPLSVPKIRKQLNIPLDKKILLNVSRLDHSKGLDNLLDTAELVYNNNKSILFYIVNSAKNKQEFLDFVKKNKFPKNCVFVGRVPYNTLNLWYAMADALIITSRREGYPRAAIEAMLCGTPSIASHTGALDDLLPKDLSFFAKKNNPISFCEIISNSFSANHKFDILRKKLAKYAFANFSEANVETIFNCYYYI